VEFVLPVAIAATVLAGIGMLIGRALYRTVPEHDPMLRMGLATKVLQDKYYLDRLYEDVIVRGIRDPIANGAYWFNDHVIDKIVYSVGAGTVRAGRSVYETGDQKGIDGAVNGLGLTALWSGAKMKLVQSGNVQLYAGAMFVGVVVLAVAFAAA
jgi:NADH:ubiquinone oxidoreductase subunit 5 (subunit L)/multisubunit Na+/H+ antiporter MnhA subunit